MMRRSLAALAIALIAPDAASAQTAATVAAPADDGATIDSLLAALYAVISGPAGPRDWTRFAALFAPDGRLVPLRATGPQVLTPQAYADRAGPVFLKQGFFEVEVARRIEQYGAVAHVFSTYESRHAPGEPPFARGINSVQLVRISGTWRVLSIAWQAETPALPIPPGYLPATPR